MRISKDYRHLNFVANILIITVGAILIGLLAYRAFYQSSSVSLEAPLLKAGNNFKGLPEIDFKKSSNTILLATDIRCQYCTQSLPFHKNIIAKSKENPNVRLIGVFSNEREEIERYLREYNIDIEFIPNVDLVKLKVDATPTIIWVDADRKIVGSYQGLLQEKQESAFFEVYQKTLSGK